MTNDATTTQINADTSELTVPDLLRDTRRYRELRVVAQGGHGIIIECTENLKSYPGARRIALKVPHQQGKRVIECQAALRREGKIGGFFSAASNILTPLYDLDLPGIRGPVLVFPFLKNGTLADQLQSRGPLPLGAALSSIVQITRAVQVLHERHLIHRDLKPENVFADDAERLLVGDLSCAVSFGEAAEGTCSGSDAIIAPEVLSGQPSGAAADIYSLGATFFCLLTSRFPFVPPDIRFHHRNTRPPDPRNWRPEIPASWVKVIITCLAKKPTDRYRSASDLLMALRGLFYEGIVNAKRAYSIPHPEAA